MTIAPRVPDFDPPAAPMSAKLTKAFDVGLWLLVATPFGRAAVPAAVSAVTAIAVSRPIRYGRGVWMGILFVVLFFAIREIIVLPVPKLIKANWLKALWVGKPRFGPLKGPTKNLFQFILRCFASLEISLPAEIESLCRRMGGYAALRTEEIYQRLYVEGGFELQDWPQVWERIQQTGFSGVTYGEVIRSNRWEIFFIRYDRVVRMVFPLAALYAVGIIWLLGDVAQGKNPLRLVQFALAAGFIIAFIIFINFTTSFRVFTVFGKSESLQIRQEILQGADPGSLASLVEEDPFQRDPELQDEVERHAGEEYYSKISIKPGYIEAIRNMFIRDFLALELIIAAGIALVLAIQWPISYEFSHWTSSQVNAWTERMIIGISLAPIALGVALALGFMVLSRLKKFIGILATGILLAAVPPLIAYALRGSAGNVVLISSIVTAVIGVLPEAVAELIKQKPGIKAPDAKAPP